MRYKEHRTTDGSKMKINIRCKTANEAQCITNASKMSGGI